MSHAPISVTKVTSNRGRRDLDTFFQIQFPNVIPRAIPSPRQQFDRDVRVVALKVEEEGRLLAALFAETPHSLVRTLRADYPRANLAHLRRVLFLERLAVLPSERGRGIATALIAELERLAFSDGVDDIVGLVSDAADFYSEAGYALSDSDDSALVLECTLGSVVADDTPAFVMTGMQRSSSRDRFFHKKSGRTAEERTETVTFSKVYREAMLTEGMPLQYPLAS